MTAEGGKNRKGGKKMAQNQGRRKRGRILRRESLREVRELRNSKIKEQSKGKM